MAPRDRARRILHRRDVLRTGGTALGLVALGGCRLLSTDPADSQPAGRRPAAKGREAPQLAELVEAGQLRPVDQRLPADPLVIEPVDRIGTYGGTWNTAVLGPADTAWLDRTIGYDYLVRWNPQWTDVIANVAASVETTEGGRVYTFRLRRGMRWSDGEPFTADDIVFAYDDVLGSADLYPEGRPSLFCSVDGKPATLERIDAHTVRFVFGQPNGVFLQELATPSGSPLTTHPRHYLQQFHRAYNPDVQQIVEQEGQPSWVELFLAKSDVWAAPEMPTLFGWYLTSGLGTGSQVVARRNPYYWKTDPEGSQLPYIDEVVYDVIDNTEVMLLKASNGEFDLHTRHINDLQNKPVLARNREENGYRFLHLVPGTMNQMIIMVNITHRKPWLRRIFANRDFRIGLSYAIDRGELIDAVFQQQGKPWQGAPRAESEFYDEAFAKQYTAYDPDQANRHLDLAGYSRRDGEGYRVDSGGRRIAFSVEIPVPTVKATWVPAMELVRRYWRDVGIDIRLQSEDRALWNERVIANQHDAVVWQGDGGLQDALLYAYYYLPYHEGSRYAIPWSNWYLSRGASGEEPPEAAKRQLELYDQVRSTVEEDKRQDLFDEILRIAKEQFYVIGTVQLTEEYGIVAEDFHNVPESMPVGYLYPTPAPTRPEQYFIAG